jgi:hypothetical protein
LSYMPIDDPGTVGRGWARFDFAAFEVLGFDRASAGRKTCLLTISA